jgi:16S rRNA (guanine527-N7)-methyltransferase
MNLAFATAYANCGLDGEAVAMLARLGDLVLEAGFNVTAVREPEEIERRHFLDSLSLLALAAVSKAQHIVDIGSGGGFPALPLALALPNCRVTALESQRKKCSFIERTAEELGLANVRVVCARAEDYGRGIGRTGHDLAVSRALASLPVVAEYSLPLLEIGGHMVAMKGQISNQECIQASKALGILGAGELEALYIEPFEGSVNRWAYVARKVRSTPAAYPRQAGTPAKRPLGEA